MYPWYMYRGLTHVILCHVNRTQVRNEYKIQGIKIGRDMCTTGKCRAPIHLLTHGSTARLLLLEILACSVWLACIFPSRASFKILIRAWQSYEGVGRRKLTLLCQLL